MEFSISWLSGLSSYFSFITWRDLIEICVISTVFYWSSLWLKNDKNKNLLPYFYGYLFFIFASYGLHLSTLTSFLFLCSPVVAMLFIVMHQHLLQHNFVSLKNVTLATHAPSADWLSALMKATLTLLTHNKNSIIIIEHTDALSPHLTASEHLEAPITQGLIHLLLAHICQSDTAACWITSNGLIRGINAQLKTSWHPHTHQSRSTWIDDAVAYTSNTDAVFLFTDALQHNYTIVHNGIVTENITMEYAQSLIKKHINYHVPLGKGYRHGVSHQKKFAQPSP